MRPIATLLPFSQPSLAELESSVARLPPSLRGRVSLLLDRISAFAREGDAQAIEAAAAIARELAAGVRPRVPR